MRLAVAGPGAANRSHQDRTFARAATQASAGNRCYPRYICDLATSMTTHRVNIRRAVSKDVASLIELDLIAQRDFNRAAFIKHAVTASQCWIATRVGDGSSAIGFGVLNQTFFEQNFVPLIVVGEGARRMGIGITILRELASQCRGTKLFTSTNASNTPMRALLLKCGFVESGYIDNLDEGDPELIFVKLATV